MKGYICPRCGSELVLRKGPRTPFWGCSAFPSCRYTANDDNGEPAKQGQPKPVSGQGAQAGRAAADAAFAGSNGAGCSSGEACGSGAVDLDAMPAWLDEIPVPDFDEVPPEEMEGGDFAGVSYDEPPMDESIPYEGESASDGRGHPQMAAAGMGAGQESVQAYSCPRCGRTLRQRKGVRGLFWGCTGYPGCRFTTDDRDGAPVLQGAVQEQGTQAARQYECPLCGRNLRRRNGVRGAFWGCTGYPGCRFTTDDRDGEPVLAAKK